MKVAVWLHQFDRAGLASFDDLRAQWPGPVYIKALDGINWMADFDRSPLAISGPADLAPPSRGGSGGAAPRVNLFLPLPVRGEGAGGGASSFIPWTVPTAVAAFDEGRLTAELANQAHGVILDLEPYEHFWRGDRADAQRFVDTYRAASLHRFWISLDYRRLPFPHPVFHDLAERYLPQCYWTTFRRAWREVLEECEARLTPYGKPIDYVLPGDAQPDDLTAGLDWCASRGADVSVWVWQTIRPENWDLLQARLPSPDEEVSGEGADPLVTQNAALINRLGYLQGDVARAIRSPLQRLRTRLRDRTSRGLAEAALAAVDTLEREGIA